MWLGVCVGFKCNEWMFLFDLCYVIVFLGNGVFECFVIEVKVWWIIVVDCCGFFGINLKNILVGFD